jgi:uncharacterized membrane protein
MMAFWLFIIHAAATWFMTGVIWFVQIVHYPLFSSIDPAKFPEYEKAHQRLTTYVVLPAMVVEAGAAMLIAVRRPDIIEAWIPWAGLVLLAVIWLSTFLSQVPQHEKLARGFDHTAHALLVSSNWVRTVAWTGRSFLAALLLYQLMV